jgi:molecular chaperone DnaJ
MSKQDYYELLGVDRSASAEELKRAYRKLAMEHHPDRNPDNPEAERKFKGINEAYDVLRDDQKRAAYDRFGHAAFEGGNGGGRPGGFDFSQGFADIFDEMFGDFMGGGGARRRNANLRGADVRFNLSVTLEEAFKGKEAKVRVDGSGPCESCSGTGAAGGAAPVTCPTCKGHGRVRATQGMFTIERTCPTCHGAGRVIEKPCQACNGSGRTRKEKTLSVNIPPGVEDGTRIRVAGEGEAGLRGGPPGDLYIFLSVKPHRVFVRDGADIHCRVPIRMTMASLGGSIEVPTIEGQRMRIQVPAGTQSGHQFRLRGRGMKQLRSTARGDMYVETVVETPVNLSKRQRELLEEFDQAEGGKSTSPESEGFFARMKELWDDLRD